MRYYKEVDTLSTFQILHSEIDVHLLLRNSADGLVLTQYKNSGDVEELLEFTEEEHEEALKQAGDMLKEERKNRK